MCLLIVDWFFSRISPRRHITTVALTKTIQLYSLLLASSMILRLLIIPLTSNLDLKNATEWYISSLDIIADILNKRRASELSSVCTSSFKRIFVKLSERRTNASNCRTVMGMTDWASSLFSPPKRTSSRIIANYHVSASKYVSNLFWEARCTFGFAILYILSLWGCLIEHRMWPLGLYFPQLILGSLIPFRNRFYTKGKT